MKFTYNAESAERSESSGASIRETGAYILTIWQCAWRKSADETSKAEMLDFVLGDPASKAKVLTRLIIKKRDGSESFGMNQFQALLGLLGVTEANVVEAKVYNLDNSFKVGHRILEVERKNIGVVLQYVEETNEQGFQVLNERGYPKYHMDMRAFFDPKTRLTIGEKAKGITKAERIDKLVASLEDVRGKSPSVDSQSFESPTPVRASAPASSAPATPSSVADDIPF
jgi:hypothetical protein